MVEPAERPETVIDGYDNDVRVLCHIRTVIDAKPCFSDGVPAAVNPKEHRQVVLFCGRSPDVEARNGHVYVALALMRGAIQVVVKPHLDGAYMLCDPDDV